MEQDFHEPLAAYLQYPDSLYSPIDDESYRRLKSYFEETLDKLFDNQKIWVPIKDFGFPRPTRLPHRSINHNITAVSDLEKENGLSWPARGQESTATLTQDPLCRFILLERASWATKLMRLDKETLFRILTYHQVPLCYLNFLTCCGSHALTGATDLSFSGFRDYVTLQQPNMASLRRSGRHYQISLRLESTRFDPYAYVDHNADESTNNPDKDPKVMFRDVNKYKAQTAVVHHYFDLHEGTALQRFNANLDILKQLADWSIGDMDLYLQVLDEAFNDASDKYLYPIIIPGSDGDETQDIVEKDLRIMTLTVQTLERCRIRIENNIRVLQRLTNFYQELLTRLQTHGLTLSWQDDAHQSVTSVRATLEVVIDRTNNILARVGVLEKITSSRADYIQKLLENGTNKIMKKLSIITSEDSSTMRIFAFITLVLLPVTVVSTVLSTDIVNFNDLPDGDGGTGNGTNSSGTQQTYVFSWLAFKTWIIAGIILTTICLGSTWAWVALAKLRSKNGGLRNWIQQGGKRREELDVNRHRKGRDYGSSPLATESSTVLQQGPPRTPATVSQDHSQSSSPTAADAMV